MTLHAALPWITFAGQLFVIVMLLLIGRNLRRARRAIDGTLELQQIQIDELRKRLDALEAANPWRVVRTKPLPWEPGKPPQ